MPATSKTRGNSRPNQAWPEQLTQALNDLGTAKQKYPDLFPHGITKIQLEFGLSEKTRVAILVEGPLKKE